MNKLVILSIIFLSFYHASAQPSSIYITASPLSCNNYTFKIEVIEFGQQESDLLMSDILLFGDGTSAELQNGSFELDGFNPITRYTFEHSYPGPGVYTIAARFYNRSSHINNMTNSVNTPFHVETKIMLDPFLGCNNTPKLELIPLHQKKGIPYKFDISCLDVEGDSLSYEVVTPLQKQDVPVVDYWIPYDSELNKTTSKLAIDQYNGSLLLNSDFLNGTYTVAVKVNEWRKIENNYHVISNSTLDYNIVYQDTENNPPQITGLQDTVIMTDSNFNLEATATDPDNDQIQFNCIGNFFQIENNTQFVDTSFQDGPITRQINFVPSILNSKATPYKGIFYAVDKNSQYNSLCNYKSIYIWIADKIHAPDPVVQFTGQEIALGVVKLSWIDTEDELGYIIERADKYFPEFERLAVLPADLSSFNDSSVVDGNIYEYRIKAVGTTMSNYSMTKLNTTEIITSLPDPALNNDLKIFPNPSNGSFSVNYSAEKFIVDIHTISGKIAWSKEIDKPFHISKKINISTGLSTGIYIMNIYSNNNTYSEKIIIN